MVTTTTATTSKEHTSNEQLSCISGEIAKTGTVQNTLKWPLAVSQERRLDVISTIGKPYRTSWQHIAQQI